MADCYTTSEFQKRKTANKMTTPEKKLQVFAANQNAHIKVLHVYNVVVTMKLPTW